MRLEPNQKIKTSCFSKTFLEKKKKEKKDKRDKKHKTT